MIPLIHRRSWIKKSALALTGFGFVPNMFAADKYHRYDLPPDAILLNSNENAYGPPPLAYRAMMENISHSNRYPDDYAPLLIRKLADHWSVNPENILLGAGASEIIGLACMLISGTKGHVITAEPSYKVWQRQATASGLSFQVIPLNGERVLNVSKMFESMNDDTRMIYVCNPNNPTGTVASMNEIAGYATEASERTLVLIDEAYLEFAALESLATLAASHKNVVVAKTFSKIYGLAGARIGYAIAHPETIKTLSNYQPWPNANVSVASVAAATAALDDKTFVQQCFEKNNSTKEMCYNTFQKLSLEYIPSRTNFILFDISNIQDDFQQLMQGRNIYVQFRDHFGRKWCRVTMGTPEEMEIFIKALEEIVNG